MTWAEALTILCFASVAHCNLQKGVYFIHDSSFLITHSKWTLVVDYTFDDLTEQLNLIKDYVEKTKSLFTKMHNIVRKETKKFVYVERRELEPPSLPHLPVWNLTEQELAYLEHSLHETIKDYKEMRTAVTITRDERGLFDIVGKGFKFLFGVSTNDDIEALNSKIDSFRQSQKELFHVLEAQATVLNQTLQAVEVNSQKISALVKQQEQLEIEVNDQNALDLVKSFLYLSKGFLEDFKIVLANIREGTDYLSQGKLSSYLFTSERLLEVLLKIKAELPRGVTFVHPPTADYLPSFYKWMTVTPVALTNTLRLFVDIPLISPNGFFDLYEILPFPSYVPSVDTFISYRTRHSYIAVSRNKQTYLLLDDHELLSCRQSSVPLCSPKSGIFGIVQHSCEYALFMGNEKVVNESCEKYVIPRPSPLFRKIDRNGTWIYSAPNSSQLTIECPWKDNHYLTKTATQTLNKTGTFSIPTMCVGHSGGIELPPHFQSQSSMHIPVEKDFVIPAIPDILNENERDIIQEMKLYADKSDTFRAVLNRENSPLKAAGMSLRHLNEELLKYKTSLEDTNSFSTLLYQNSPALGTIALIIVVVVIILICYLKYKSPWPRLSSKASTKEEIDGKFEQTAGRIRVTDGALCKA